MLLRQLTGHFDTLSKIHDAADAGKWAEYASLMGGVFCKRDEQPVRPLYIEKVNRDTGEVKQSYFDEVITIALKGVRYAATEVITRAHEWRVEHQPEKAA